MNYFDDENRIIEHLHHTQPSYAIHPDDTQTKQILMSIYDKDIWGAWINSSGKSDPPPDFYNNKLELMMDIMRVDDHSQPGKKGKIINPTNMRESVLQKELDKIFPSIPKMINAVTELKGVEDHNYGFYIENFRRVVNKHIEQIPMYKKNHPGYKLIFYVFDESSAYMEAVDKTIAQKGIHYGQAVYGRKHIFYLDREMLKHFFESDVDYLLWHTPFKRYFFTDETNQLPQVAFIKLRELQ